MSYQWCRLEGNQRMYRYKSHGPSQINQFRTFPTRPSPICMKSFNLYNQCCEILVSYKNYFSSFFFVCVSVNPLCGFFCFWVLKLGTEMYCSFLPSKWFRICKLRWKKNIKKSPTLLFKCIFKCKIKHFKLQKITRDDFWIIYSYILHNAVK